jgi:integrase
MGTIRKRVLKAGTRYTARVRLEGNDESKTFATKGAAEGWVRAKEGAIETGTYLPTDPEAGKLFADAVDIFVKHRHAIRRPPGKTFTNTLTRLKEELGLIPLSTMTIAYWRKYALDRIKDDGVASQTAASELLYAASVLQHARRERWGVDAEAPGHARRQMREEGLRVTSRQREGRIDDDKLAELLKACDTITSGVPLGDIVRFALATSMRRGEILSIRWDDVSGRVVKVRNRKHPRDHERVDDVPLLKANDKWSPWDALEIIRRQPRKGALIFPYQGDTVCERFEHACANAGLTGIVFHLMRHESLSRYAERGMDIIRLQMIGGHRDLRHLKRYVALDAERFANE